MCIKAKNFRAGDMPYIKFEVNYTGKDSRFHSAEYDITSNRVRYRGGWTGM